MKKIINVLLVLVVFLGFKINAKAVYVSFNLTDVTDESTKVGYMEGVALRNGIMPLNIQDSNPNDGIDPNNMERDGYTFAGWVEHQPTPNDNILTIDNENKTISFSANGDPARRDAYATWNLIDYSITYNLGNGGVLENSTTTYNIESQTFTIGEPTRPGYIFDGWDDENGRDQGTSIEIATGNFGDREYTARWTAIDYDITYELDGGEVENQNPSTYNADTEVTLNNPEKEHYDFAGWEGTDLDEPTMDVTIQTGSIGDREYTATYTPKVYKITYNLSGGTAENPSEYTIESPDITLATPTREGYIFIGWEGTDLDETIMEVTIANGSFGDRRYIAMWEEVKNSGEKTKSLNPQTEDDVLKFVTLISISGLGIVLNKKKRYS